MRKYLIFYYAEIRDECTDLEAIVEAHNIREAIDEFEKQTMVFKRIFTITELPYEPS